MSKVACRWSANENNVLKAIECETLTVLNCTLDAVDCYSHWIAHAHGCISSMNSCYVINVITCGNYFRIIFHLFC